MRLFGAPGSPGTQGLLDEAARSGSGFREAADKVMNAFERDTLATDSSASVQGKQTLGQRFILPGDGAGLETQAQQMSDAVQADLFSYQPSTEQGINNSVYLAGMQNEALRFAKPSWPRQQIPSELVLPFEPSWQFQPINREIVDATMQDGRMELVAGAYAQQSNWNLLGDDQRRTGNYLVPGAPQPGRFRHPLFAPVPAFAANAIGFKPQESYWRTGLFPDRTGVITDPPPGLSRIQTYGFMTGETF